MTSRSKTKNGVSARVNRRNSAIFGVKRVPPYPSAMPPFSGMAMRGNISVSRDLATEPARDTGQRGSGYSPIFSEGKREIYPSSVETKQADRHTNITVSLPRSAYYGQHCISQPARVTRWIPSPDALASRTRPRPMPLICKRHLHRQTHQPSYSVTWHFCLSN